MKTQIVKRAYLLTLLFASGVAILAWAQDPPGLKPVAKEAAPVSVESFNSGNVIGYLGAPLGTIVRVTGITVDGKTLLIKGAEGKTFLRVETVNGKALKKPVDFEFLRVAKEVSKPKPDERFDYYVHEYGEFDGNVDMPEELINEPKKPGNMSGNVIGIAAPGFHYQHRVTVHQSQPVKK
ncbi:hypothetical protein [Zavarzinella formosa]|uniref:hypothetical protein n=1 Tax=Zavarzinella formosa TaxID=360055 RepID=UPI0002EFD6B5|nr:hypothetical protein [Zavarzinella formosa]